MTWFIFWPTQFIYNGHFHEHNLALILLEINVDEFTIYESFLIFSDYLMLWLLAKYQLKVICKIAMLYKEKVGEKENNKTFLYQSSNPLFASIYFAIRL